MRFYRLRMWVQAAVVGLEGLPLQVFLCVFARKVLKGGVGGSLNAAGLARVPSFWRVEGRVGLE